MSESNTETDAGTTARTETGTTAPLASLGFRRAAAALKLRPGELDLALRLGYVRSAAGATVGSGRVPLDEVERLRALDGHPESLRERVRTVATAGACRLASTTRDRFTKLARTGHITPVGFYLNRYHTVVWLYLASEVAEFADGHPDLLNGRLPAPLRARLDGGEDWRARNWRGRHIGMLLRQAPDAWARAAAIASVLTPAVVAEVVHDPRERAYVEFLRPDPPGGPPASFAVRALRNDLLLADDPDEVAWHRRNLCLALDEARAWRPAPRPDGEQVRPPSPCLPGAVVPAPAAAALGGGRDPRTRQVARRLLTRLSPRGKSPVGVG
ncbi:DUF6397 family protein [Streptomyces sp. NPDC127084]|uniref:DUF6397 family protein n=1 Tax=Streptomyces sp. NPDC127084 TaxID=3347133 RepID=UPI0036601E7A